MESDAPVPPASLVPVPAPASLPDLAADIRRAHASCVDAFGRGLRHAVEAGTLLIRAKGQVPHGAWLTWLATHCELSDRLAQKYMRVARDLPKLEAADPANTPRVADLSLRQALDLIAENSRTVLRVPEPERPAVLERAAESRVSILSELEAGLITDAEAELRAAGERERSAQQVRDQESRAAREREEARERERRAEQERRANLERIERQEHAILHQDELPAPVPGLPESLWGLPEAQVAVVLEELLRRGAGTGTSRGASRPLTTRGSRDLARQVVSAITDLHRRMEYDQANLAHAVYWIEDQVRDGPKTVEEMRRRAEHAGLKCPLHIARHVAIETGKLLVIIDPAARRDGPGRWEVRKARAEGREVQERLSGEIWQRPSSG